MHIAVNLGVQKIASFQVDNFLPEEVDHELNIAMDRFIKQRYSPMSNRYRKGFEQSQKRIDDLRHLIATTTLDTFSDGEAEFGEDSLFFSDRAALPNDYLFLVNLRASIIDACEPTTFSLNASENQFQRISLTPPVVGYILTGIKIYLDDDETLVAHNATGLTKDELLNPTTYTFNCIPAVSIEEFGGSWGLGLLVEQTPTVDGNELYLKINPVAYPGTLATTLVWEHPTDSTTIGGTIEPVNVAMEESSNITIRKRVLASPKTVRLVKGKYSQLDDVYTLLDDPFNTTKSTSPLYTIEENFVDVYSTTEFVTQTVRVKYIRRPQRMSKSLGVGCELPEHTHQEIVEMAIKSILEGIQDSRYQSQSVEVTESE